MPTVSKVVQENILQTCTIYLNATDQTMIIASSIETFFLPLLASKFNNKFKL